MSTTSTRLHGDTRTLVVGVTALVAALGIVSFTAGVPGLMAVGAWALLPGWMSALVPVIVDGGILVFSLVAVVRRARHEGAVFAWSCLAILTLGSVAAQVAHVLLESGAVTATAVAGAVVAGAFPSVVFASTHAILDLAIAPAPKRGQAVQTATGNAGETGEAREQAEAEHVAEAAPAVAEQVVAAVPEVVEQKLPEAVEQPARPQVSTAIEQAPEVVEQAARVEAEQQPSRVEQPARVEAEQQPSRVEQPARPAVVKSSSTPARKPAGTGPAAGAGMVPWTGLNADGQAARQAEAIAAVRAGGSVAGTAKQVGVPRSSLQRWVAAELEEPAAA